MNGFYGVRNSTKKPKYFSMDSMREDMFLTNRRTHMKPLIRPKSSAQVIFVLKINRVGKWIEWMKVWIMVCFGFGQFRQGLWLKTYVKD